MSAMSVGPAEDYEHHTDPSDVAAPTRPSERGAWRNHWDDDDEDGDGDEATERLGATRSPQRPKTQT